MSRQSRILGSESVEVSFYHVMSRCVDRQMAFDDIAKAKFRQILRNQLAFSGVECATFCLMGNHLSPPGRGALGPEVTERDE